MQKDIQSNFDVVRKYEFRGELLSGIDSLSFPFSSQEEIEQAAHTATHYWQSSFSSEEMVTKLGDYLEQSNDDLRKYFKKVRKAGLILKSAYQVLDKQHQIDEGFWLFLKKLGHLNDLFGLEESKDVVNDLLTVLKKYDLSHEGDNIQVESLANTKSELINILREIKTLVDQESVSYPQFHKVRKKMRHVMNMYQLTAANSQDQLAINSFAFFNKVNTILGDEHDQMVAAEITGESEYESSVYTWPAEIKEILLSVCQHFLKQA